MEKINEAFRLITIIQKVKNFQTLTDVANFFGVTPGAINGLMRRNAVDTILKRAVKNGMDANFLIKSLKNFDAYVKSDENEMRLEPKDLLDFEKSEDIILKKRETIKKNLEAEKEKELANYKQTLSLLSETKNGFSKEFQYAFWSRFEEIKEAIFEGFNNDYWNDSTPERAWDNQKIEAEFEKLLKSVVEKDNLVILEV